MQQVNRDHYEFERYSYLERWASYFYQLRETLNLKPSSVLEVGVGDKVFGEYIKNNTQVKYTSVDIASDLKPDVVASVSKLPFEDNSFDVVCIFEVLEHLPYLEFEKALKEIARVTRKYTIVSVPHFGPPVKLLFKFPFIKEVKMAFKIPYFRKHVFKGEHHWEIGKEGYPNKKILESMEQYFIVEKHFVPFENQYHHFFILRLKS